MKIHNNLIYIFLTILLLCYNVNAIKIGEEKPSLVDTVIITNENWADCISSVDYAYNVDGIILQTEGDELNPNVENMVKAVNPKKIIIVGGPLAVSKNVENKLKKYGRVIRIWGNTRVETNEKLLKLLNSNNTKILVNGYDFKETVSVSKERYYDAVYASVIVFNPNDVIRIYYNDTVKIYTINNQLIGIYKKNEVKEVPNKVIVLIKPNISTEYCNNENIAKFGYKIVDIPNYYMGIPVDKNSPTSLLLSRYLDVPVVIGNETEPVIYFNGNSINNSITVAVDILVLKRAKELYNKNNDLKQSLYEAKTQLWSKNIPVEKYNIPYDYAERYILQ